MDPIEFPTRSSRFSSLVNVRISSRNADGGDNSSGGSMEEESIIGLSGIGGGGGTDNGDASDDSCGSFGCIAGIVECFDADMETVKSMDYKGNATFLSSINQAKDTLIRKELHLARVKKIFNYQRYIQETDWMLPPVERFIPFKDDKLNPGVNGKPIKDVLFGDSPKSMPHSLSHPSGQDYLDDDEEEDVDLDELDEHGHDTPRGAAEVTSNRLRRPLVLDNVVAINDISLI